ncbi:hypothetical protein [Patulibacter sp. SYSU D01012]|uniref:hypothetical protein n=1 Tax=Patulibacter sp. SYSU D01012 TaxID=2817381 RepID=UPI001B30B008|nr:hypothetical protein [Patulibacter sp. SYSU D01012]
MLRLLGGEDADASCTVPGCALTPTLLHREDVSAAAVGRFVRDGRRKACDVRGLVRRQCEQGLDGMGSAVGGVDAAAHRLIGEVRRRQCCHHVGVGPVPAARRAGPWGCH